MNDFHIPDMARRYTEYDMIQSHTELPDFPASRARLLCAFLKQPEQGAKGDSDLYSLATSLVQLGIDTHEMVAVSNEVKEKRAVRSRQLKVLAGDYFSSRFYQLLAQAGQIEMVKQISASICEVNRLKMTFYTRIRQLKLTAEEYIQHSVQIRSQLFLHFNRLMDGIAMKLWPDILQGYMRCEVLAGELARSEASPLFRGSWGYWHILQNGTKEERKQLEAVESDDSKYASMLLKYNIKGQLHHMLEEQIRAVTGRIRELDSDKLVQELIHIGEPFLRIVSQQKVLEEH